MLHLYAIVAAIGIVAAALGLGEWHGREAGADKVQAKWDAEKSAAAQLEQKARKGDNDAGYRLAAELVAQAQKSEQRYVQASTDLRKALTRPISCPPGGKVGDVLLPADVVRSMFNRADPGGGAPGPAAAQPDAALRGGAAAP